MFGQDQQLVVGVYQAGNRRYRWIFSVVPLPLLQSSFFSESIAYWSVSSWVLPTSFREFVLLASAIPFAMLRICFLLITLTNALHFFQSYDHPKGLVQKVKNNIFIGGVFEIIFPRVYCCPIKTAFIIFQNQLLL